MAFLRLKCYSHVLCITNPQKLVLIVILLVHQPCGASFWFRKSKTSVCCCCWACSRAHASFFFFIKPLFFLLRFPWWVWSFFPSLMAAQASSDFPAGRITMGMGSSRPWPSFPSPFLNITPTSTNLFQSNEHQQNEKWQGSNFLLEVNIAPNSW